MTRAPLAAPLALLAACSQAPALEPAGLLSAEIEVGGAAALQAGPGARPPVRIAAGGGEYLAVWSDEADGAGRRVVGARVGPGGEVLDTVGLTIARGRNPAVASDGAGYLVALSDKDLRIVAARVGLDGEVLDRRPIVIDDGPAVLPRVAFDGERYLVAWADATEIRYVAVTPNGEVIEPVRVIPTPGANGGGPRGLACGAGSCLFAWNELSSVRGMFTGGDPGGFAIAPSGPSPLGPPSVAHDGASFVVAWPTANGVRAARAIPGPTVLDPAGIEVSSAPYPEDVEAAFDGESTVLAWHDGSLSPSLRVARLSPGGELQGASSATLASNVESSAIAGNGDGSFAVWSLLEPDPGQPWLLGTRLGRGGEALDAPGIPLHAVASAQQLPTIAFDGERYLVAWVGPSDRPGDPEWTKVLHAARVAPSGDVLDPEGIRLADGVDTLLRPRVVFDGTNTVVLWWQAEGACEEGCTHRLRAIRVSPEGDVLDPVPIELPLATEAPTSIPAASNGAGTFLVGDINGQATGLWVGSSGEVERARSFGSGGRGAAVGSDGDGYLAVWPVESETGTGLFGVRIGAAGGVLDAGGLPLAPKEALNHRPAVGFDGERYVVAWERLIVDPEAPLTPRSQVRATRVSRDGEILDPGGVLLAEDRSSPLGSHRLSDPAVGSDGRRALIAWRGPADPDDPLSSLDLFAATLGADGPPDPVFTLSGAPLDEGPADLAGSCGEVLAAYDRFRPEAPYGARRTLLRRVDLGGDECTEPLVAAGGCRAAGAPPPGAGSGWLAAALAGLIAAAARRRSRVLL